MKKRIVSLLLALVMAVSLLPVSAFAADDYELRVLTFEDADYKGGTNFAGGSNWSSLIDDPQYMGPLLYGSGGGFSSEEEAYKWTDANNTGLTHVFPYNYGSYCYWGGGHAISNYSTGDIKNYGGFEAQLTVYKKGVSGLSRTGGGHNGSNNFAVHYGYIDGSEYNKTDVLPTLTFADGSEHVIDHMYVNNTTYLLNCLVNGNDLTAKIGPDDWVKLIAIGYNAAGTKTGQVSIYLCNGPDNIVMDWTKWDLSSLGKVNSVMFNVTGSSDNGYGFSQPAYFAYDDVAVRFEKAGADVPATGVTLDKTELSLTEGASASLTAAVTPADTTDKLAWTSSNEDVATVKDGTVTAVKAGTAIITAACGAAADTCTVTVTAAPAGPLSVKVGAAAYPVKPVDGQAGKYHAAVPYGSDVTVTIDADASAFFMITDAKGNYTDFYSNPFTATAAQLDKLLISKDIPFTPANSASKVAYLSIMDAMAGTTYELYIELTCEAVPATGVTLSETALSLRPTEKATLTATVAPENTTDTLVWTSSNDAVATVKDGVVTAKSEGTATITAACGSAKAECVVTVLPPIPATGVTLDKAALKLYEGDAAKLTAMVKPEDTTDKTIVWTSSDKTIATVKDGAVTAVKAGTATITAACGEAKATCAVTVKAPVAPAQKDGVYQIGTADELVWFAKQVNGGSTAISGVLTAEIDLNGFDWTPIGSSAKKFSGSFDGAGYAIKNLTINYQTAKSGERLYLGLFGYAEGTKDNRAAIKNLTVQGSVNAGSEFSVYSGNVAGVVACGSYVGVSGVISRVNVTVDAKVGSACGVGGLAGVLINSTATNCGSGGNVSGVKNLGGLCYEFYAGTMTGCYNTGAVSGSGTCVGGIMGYAKQAAIKDVYNTGAVSTTKNLVGGLVGEMEKSSLTNGYSTGKITVSESGGSSVGAAVGWADTLSNVYYLEGTSKKGVGRDGTAAAKTADELKAKAMPAALGNGFKRDLGNINGGYPVLSWQTSDCKHTGGTEIKDAKDATCTENGYTGDIYCKSCGAKLESGKVIPAAGHKGGTATCKDKAVCEVCQQPYGELNKNNHTGGTEVKDAKDATCTENGYTGDTCCKGCGAKLESGKVIPAAGHKGGTATCKDKAVCEVCQQPYGELNKNNHTGGTEVKDAKDATCTENGYTGDTCCKGCGAKLESGKVIPAAGHKGGTATCKDKALCEVCRQPYGELDKGNHADLKKVDAKKATYTKEGNITYWYCDGCGKYYSDAEATKEITKADTVIPRKTHSSNSGSTGTGSGSGNTNSGSTGSGADVKKGVQSSKTGDAGVALYAAMSLLSLTGGAVVLGRKRKAD